MVKQVTAEELKQLRQEGKKIVCDFWAAWCGPCRMLAPVMDALAKEFEGSAEFVKINIDEEPQAAMEMGIMSIPDVYIFDGEKTLDHNLGFVPEEELRSFLKRNL